LGLAPKEAYTGLTGGGRTEAVVKVSKENAEATP
jgi:hypothetical protein